MATGGCGSTASPSASPSPSASGGGSTPSVASDGVAPSCPPIPPIAPAPTGTDGPGWWANRVFYEAFVRSFADSDGDGVGDLAGLTAKLDYLNDGDATTTSDLGVTGLWLMPTFPSPSYHGYDVTDYTGVNEDYGTLDDLRTLVGQAHRRGIAVLLDLPLNHTSAKHPWFVASAAGRVPYGDWYRWAAAPGGNGWQQAPDGRFYYAAFGSDLPDLNLENAAVTAELTKDAEFWLEDVGVDGFRLDAAKYLIEDGAATQNTPETHAWWKAFRSAIETRKPGALLLGEVYDTPQNSSSYVPDDLDLTFDFASASTMVTAAQSGDGSSVQRALTRITTLYPSSSGYGAFLTNHDQDRIASQLKGDDAELKLAADLLLLGPGIPFVYYGEEIGMTGAKPDERIRTPMRWNDSTPAAGFSTGTPWEPLSDDPPSVNVAAEAASATSLWSRYRDLIRLRTEHPALATGVWTPITTDAPTVVAALRVAPSEVVVTLTNAGASAVSPTLTMAGGSLCGSPRADALLGAASVAAPVVSADGGVAGWQPVPSIPARSSVVIALASGGG